MVHNPRIPGESVPKPPDSGVRTKNPAATPSPLPEHSSPIENQSRLEALIGSIDEIVFELDRNGTFLNIWTTNEELLYRPRHELKGKRVSDVIGEEFFRPFSLIFDRVLVTGRSEELEYSLDVPAGKRWFLARMNRIPPAEGVQYTLCLAVRDITERKQAEIALRDSEARLQALVGAIDEIVFEQDADGLFLNIWTSNEALLSHPRRELLGRRSSEVFGEEVFRPFREVFRRVLETGQAEDVEYSFDVLDGRKWFLGRVNRIPSAHGSRETVCFVVRDITDRKHAEEKLRVSEEKFSKAFHLGPDAIAITSIEDGRFIEVNDTYLRLTGFTRGEIIGRTSVELGLWSNPKDHQHIVALLKRSGEVRDLELRIPIKSGDLRVVQMSAHTIELAGEPCMIAISRDVTERRALEAQLRQAQKMEAVGRLAGGVAHDFNNLLVGILGYSELLRKRLTEQGSLLRMANEINFAAMRARDLTSRLLALSHRQILQPAVLDLNAHVRQCEQLLRPIIGEDVRVVQRLDPKIGSVKADPAQLEQVILNLALNARDAMPRGGTLCFETCNIHVDPALARQHPGLIPGSYVRLQVADTGHGIAPDVMPRIFEPFFTTKEIGKGSGLGLSTVYGVVKQSGGCVTVSSEPSKGAAFGIYLPRASELPQRRIPAQPATASSTGTETILLVEDEAVVRDLVCEILRESGYVVLSANSGADAMEITAEHVKPIDLLITDVVMPEMSGPELANTLRRARGEMRVLYMSGYTDDAVLVRQGLPENSAFIRKPYTPQQFLQKVRESLDATPRRVH
jgi:two-component system cell cycle sensor histidine kinase/response regulator CckA